MKKKEQKRKKDMRNGFEKHDIKYTSASNINAYCNAPCQWAARYIFKEKFPTNNAMKAGNIAEAAIENVLLGRLSLAEAIKTANELYAKETAISASASDLKRGEAIEGMITNAVNELKQYGEPEEGSDIVFGKKQKKVELLCKGDGWDLPVIGYLDFYFPKHGIVVDLKTTMKAPSVMSLEHKRQGSIYKSAMSNHAVKFLYVTGKKAVWHEVEDHAEVMADIKTILHRQERLLRLDKEEIRKMIPVVGGFYWSGAEDIRKKLYGI